MILYKSIKEDKIKINLLAKILFWNEVVLILNVKYEVLQL